MAAPRRRRRCPTSRVPFATEHNHVDADGNAEFWPYLRDPDTLARPWAIPGTPGLMHRVGGLEKADGHGQHQLHAGEPRADGRPAGRQDRRGRRATSRRSRSSGDDDADCASSAGARRGPRSTPRCSAAAGPGTRWRGSTSRTSTRCRTISATCCAASEGARARAQPGPARPHRPRRVPRRRPVAHQGPGPAVHRPRDRSRDREGVRADDRRPMRAGHHQEGLGERPGGALVPGLRRLRHPAGRPAADARARHRAREHRVRLGHRLLEPLPVLHEHVRHALASTAGRRRSPPASPWPAPTSTCG